MSTHDLTLGQDGDGWDIGSCACGYVTPPVPDNETAAEIWCDHIVADIFTGMTERIEQLQRDNRERSFIIDALVAEVGSDYRAEQAIGRGIKAANGVQS